jgi:hypothetical protein
MAIKLYVWDEKGNEKKWKETKKWKEMADHSHRKKLQPGEAGAATVAEGIGSWIY